MLPRCAPLFCYPPYSYFFLSTTFLRLSFPFHALCSSPIFQYSSAHTTLARMQRFSLTPSEFPSTHYTPDYRDCSSRRYSSSTPSCARLFVCTCTVLSCSISSSCRDTAALPPSHTPPSLLMYTNNPFYCLILASHLQQDPAVPSQEFGTANPLDILPNCSTTPHTNSTLLAGIGTTSSTTTTVVVVVATPPLWYSPPGLLDKLENALQL